MADQKINELPTKTAPSTGDKMLMIGAAEEYQIDYDKLASAILNKLSTQSFSSLDTTSKTVLGAIDELNSKTFLLKYGIEIDTNEDLNNLTEIGTYYSASSTITASLTNCPLGSLGFSMTVSCSTGNDYSYIRQTIYGRTNSFTPIMYVRHKSLSEWGEWCSFSDDATVMNEITSYVPTITESNSDITIGDYAYAYVFKFGRICSIQFNVKGSINTANKFITLFTLNKGYRPVNNIQHNYITQNGVTMLLNVVSSGEVQIYCVDNTITDNWIIRQCITFPCAT